MMNPFRRPITLIWNVKFLLPNRYFKFNTDNFGNKDKKMIFFKGLYPDLIEIIQ